jgi:hypothetical protein
MTLDDSLRSELLLLSNLLQTGATEPAAVLAKQVGDTLAGHGVLCVALDKFVRDRDPQLIPLIESTIRRLTV